MKTLRVYIDTSVIGGCFDDSFSKWSNGLMKDFRLGHFRPVVQELVSVEIEKAPENVRNKYAEIVDYGAEVLVITNEVLNLVEAYRKHRILGVRFGNDLLHIALATVHQADILVSWNFKHIVHFEKIQQFNKVNERMGFKSIAIYSPREVANYEEEN